MTWFAHAFFFLSFSLSFSLCSSLTQLIATIENSRRSHLRHVHVLFNSKNLESFIQILTLIQTKQITCQQCQQAIDGLGVPITQVKIGFVAAGITEEHWAKQTVDAFLDFALRKAVDAHHPSTSDSDDDDEQNECKLHDEEQKGEEAVDVAPLPSSAQSIGAESSHSSLHLGRVDESNNAVPPTESSKSIRRRRRREAAIEEHAISSAIAASSEPPPKKVKQAVERMVQAEVALKCMVSKQQSNATLQQQYDAMVLEVNAHKSKITLMENMLINHGVNDGQSIVSGPMVGPSALKRQIEINPIGCWLTAIVINKNLGVSALTGTARMIVSNMPEALRGAIATIACCFFKASYAINDELNPMWNERYVYIRIQASPESDYLPIIYGEACFIIPKEHERTNNLVGLPIPCITMELLPGISVYDWLRGSGVVAWPSLNPSDVGTAYILFDRTTQRAMFGVILEVIRSVRHLHSIGIVHRDLSPSNIMISDKPPNADGSLSNILHRVTLTDFNTSMVISDRSEIQSGIDSVEVALDPLSPGQSPRATSDDSAAAPSSSSASSVDAEGAARSAKRPRIDFGVESSWLKGTLEYSRSLYKQANRRAIKVPDSDVTRPRWYTLPPDVTEARQYWFQYDMYSLALIICDLLRGLPLNFDDTPNRVIGLYHYWCQTTLDERVDRYDTEMTEYDAAAADPSIPLPSIRLPSIVRWLHKMPELMVNEPKLQKIFGDNNHEIEDSRRLRDALNEYPLLFEALHSMTSEGWTDGTRTHTRNISVTLDQLERIVALYL